MRIWDVPVKDLPSPGQIWSVPWTGGLVRVHSVGASSYINKGAWRVGYDFVDENLEDTSRPDRHLMMRGGSCDVGHFLHTGRRMYRELP